MKIYRDISISEGVDSFCSTIGNEIVFEDKCKTNILIPCFNIGFYENEINLDGITKAIDKCYFLFRGVINFITELTPYDSLFPKEGKKIEFDGNQFKYEVNFGTNNKASKMFYLEGVFYRHNSFSYGRYISHSESLDIILLDESNWFNSYNSNDSFKMNKEVQDFLLNKHVDIGNVSNLLMKM